MFSRRAWVALLAAGALSSLTTSAAEAQTVTINTPPSFTPIAGPSGNYLHLTNVTGDESEQWELGFKATLGNGDYVFEVDICLIDPVDSGAVRLFNKYQAVGWQSPPSPGDWHTTAISFSITDASEPSSRDFRLAGVDWNGGRTSKILLDNFVLRDSLGNAIIGPLTFENDVVGSAPISLNSNSGVHLLTQFVVVPEPMAAPLLGLAGMMLMRRRQRTRPGA